ncbi:MAG: molybdopterin-binding/glycosyltransferase family 2 protein [Parvibaculaceae bacterium]|nr:molybdopterin-binding/glycosyltransferase family 2 protein [Parvibaculaceae bacterium]
MKASFIPTQKAEGALLGHSLALADRRFKKGRRLSSQDLADLQAHGHTEVFAIFLEAGDVGEDDAANRIAKALCTQEAGLSKMTAFTGRANLFSQSHGLLRVNADLIHKLNRLHEALTVATLPDLAHVAPKQMIATVKIIPFACPLSVLKEAEALLSHTQAFSVASFAPGQSGLILTTLPSTPPKLLEKAKRTLQTRLETYGGTLHQTLTCDHSPTAIAEAITTLQANNASPIFILGASATVDRADAVPAGVVAANGTVEHFGMPVDPGNLLLLARHNETPIIGMPGCARSPKLNGFDWVLERLMANLPITPDDITSMGVGGLLKEIASRPQPRIGDVSQSKTHAESPMPHVPTIAALVLAAGLSRRMGTRNKLIEEIDGKPLLAQCVDTVLAANVDSLTLVTGHEAEIVQATMGTRPISYVHNPNFADGLASSLKAGLAALPPCDAFIVCLGDMPDIQTADIQKLISAYDRDEGRLICLPVVNGKRGNPVLWDHAFANDMLHLTGDQGAKSLMRDNEDVLCEVDIQHAGPLSDIDTLSALTNRRNQSH